MCQYEYKGTTVFLQSASCCQNTYERMNRAHWRDNSILQCTQARKRETSRTHHAHCTLRTIIIGLQDSTCCQVQLQLLWYAISTAATCSKLWRQCSPYSRWSSVQSTLIMWRQLRLDTNAGVWSLLVIVHWVLPEWIFLCVLEEFGSMR